MKKSRSKLTLNRETIARLDDDQLADAAGAAKTTSVCNSICATVCQCPSYQNTICNTGCIPCNSQTGCVQTYTC